MWPFALRHEHNLCKKKSLALKNVCLDFSGAAVLLKGQCIPLKGKVHYTRGRGVGYCAFVFVCRSLGRNTKYVPIFRTLDIKYITFMQTVY